MDTIKVEEILFGFADKLRGKFPNISCDWIVFPLAAMRYAYQYQEKYQLRFTNSWGEVANDITGERVKQAVAELSQQKPELAMGLGLLDIEHIKEELPHLVYQLDKVEFEERNCKILDTYLLANAKARAKNGDFFVQGELNELVVKICDIQPQSMVYDTAVQYGRLLSAFVATSIDILCHGVAEAPEAAGLAQLYCFMAGLKHFHIEQRSYETILQQAFPERKYDYVVSHVPPGMRLDADIRTRYGIIRRDATLGFVIHALESLKADGKAVITVTNGILFQGASTGEIRRELLHGDLIEAVISLPAGMLIGAGIPVTILVLSKNKAAERKGKVQFIDASAYGKKNRGYTSLAVEEIEEIVTRYHRFKDDNKVSRIVGVSTIRDNDYNLLPSSYVQLEDADSIIGTVQIDRAAYEKFTNTIPLKHVSDIYRGLNTAGSLERNTIKAKVIQLSDVRDGKLHLDTVGTYRLKENTQLELGEIRAGDVLITSRGLAMKFVVVPALGDQGPYYLSANFIGLRPYPGVNPYFLLSFFESPLGESYIRSLRKGANLPILNFKDVQHIPIPKISTQEMERIGREYKQAQQEYQQMLAKVMQKRTSQLEYIYDIAGIRKGYKVR